MRVTRLKSWGVASAESIIRDGAKRVRYVHMGLGGLNPVHQHGPIFSHHVEQLRGHLGKDS
jgi:hypothetical protein